MGTADGMLFLPISEIIQTAVSKYSTHIDRNIKVQYRKPSKQCNKNLEVYNINIHSFLYFVYVNEIILHYLNMTKCTWIA